MAKLAFLGLGLMGAPMARRLLAAGHDVIVWNRTPEKAEPLVADGARHGSTPAEAGQGVDAALTMVADPEALDAVLFGPDGLAHGLREGATVIDMSTVGPNTVLGAAQRLPGASMLDAPVLGSVPQAEEGQLKIFTGGDPEVFERWRPILEVLGTPTLLGPLGAGASMKLVVNSTLGAVMSGIGEALALADALGLDEELTLNVLADSVVGIASAAREWFRSAERQGLGELDYTAVVAHIRGQAARAS
jgi:3-hydroxyisobutyrate dehydrogenase-like beta-hydroxyacid dehydrogenase